jgi:hypothetical protein
MQALVCTAPGRVELEQVPVLNRKRGKKKLRSRLLGSAAPTFRDFWGTALGGVHRWFWAMNWLDGVKMDGELWRIRW